MFSTILSIIGRNPLPLSCWRCFNDSLHWSFFIAWKFSCPPITFLSSYYYILCEKRFLLPVLLAPPDFRLQVIAFHSSDWWSFLLANTCSKLKIRTLEWYLLNPLKRYQRSSGFLTFSGVIEDDDVVFLVDFEEVYAHHFKLSIICPKLFQKFYLHIWPLTWFH